jgi:hypothetical protein
MRRWLPRTSLVAILLAAMSLVAGATFALLSGTSNGQTSTLSAGDVTYGNNSSSVCNLRDGGGQTAPALLPGDASTGWSPSPGVDQPCTFKVTYMGADPAYLGLDILIATRAGVVPATAPAGTSPSTLFDGSANGLQLRVTDTANTVLFDGTTYTGQGSGAGASGVAQVPCPAPYNISAYTCYQVTDLLVSSNAVSNGASDTFALDYRLPASSTSAYENAAAIVVLNVHAVQSANNPLPTTPSSLVCQTGAQCSSGLSWN